ncbi:MAG: YraN family protein [Desulfovibrionaceae bacterium]|nr:YraN family protein [Desulfovibrionaceae bacterium]
MMTDKQIRGAEGEELAAAYLSRQGFRILHRNWHFKSLELDIVAMDGDTLVFVEVRTRRAGGKVSGLESLNAAKLRHVRDAARVFLHMYHLWNIPCRCDAVGIALRKGSYEVQHVRNIDLSEIDSRSSGRRYASWQPW